MTHLSVNVNKLATLRNSRGKNMPDVVTLSERILDYGAHGITVHPRPDGRHILWSDVAALNRQIAARNAASGLGAAEFNIEGFPSREFIAAIGKYLPSQCTLVPDPPEALTSNAGWDLVGREPYLAEVIRDLRNTAPKVRVSLFVDPEGFGEDAAAALARLRPDRIELYTEAFADHFDQRHREAVTAKYVKTARVASDLGIGVNAGHDLNQRNLKYLLDKIPTVAEVSIGHALICEALEQGLESTVKSYLQIVDPQ